MGAHMPAKGAKRAKRIVRRKTKAKNLITHVAFVLDRSGSMGSVRDVTVKGYNEQVDTIRASAAKTKTVAGLTLFNNTITHPFFGIDGKDVKYLELNDYTPDGSTAFNDAILATIAKLQETVKDTPETSYLVVALTDGQENASRASASEVRNKVNELQATGRWTFSVIGANINLADLSTSTGIIISNVTSYVPDSLGTTKALRSVSQGIGTYMTMREQGATASSAFYAGTENDPNVTITENDRDTLKVARKIMKEHSKTFKKLANS